LTDPVKLTRALGIDGSFYGEDLVSSAADMDRRRIK
jgi:hypothetical protein